jgi:hypothetical protein
MSAGWLLSKVDIGSASFLIIPPAGNRGANFWRETLPCVTITVAGNAALPGWDFHEGAAGSLWGEPLAR